MKFDTATWYACCPIRNFMHHCPLDGIADLSLAILSCFVQSVETFPIIKQQSGQLFVSRNSFPCSIFQLGHVPLPRSGQSPPFVPWLRCSTHVAVSATPVQRQELTVSVDSLSFWKYLSCMPKYVSRYSMSVDTNNGYPINGFSKPVVSMYGAWNTRHQSAPNLRQL